MRNKKVVTEKWMLKKMVHFGGVKETFKAGSVFDVNTSKEEFSVEGRIFSGTKDIETAKRMGILVPYSEESKKEVGIEQERLAFVRSNIDAEPKFKTMKIIKSDADLMDKDIDIRWTKKAKAVPEVKEKNGKLPVVRGNESVEERNARVEKLKSSIPVMPIVVDESLSADKIVKPSLNAKAAKKSRKVSV